MDPRQVQEPGGPPRSPRRLDRPEAAVLEALVAVHVETHGGDVEKSLAAIPANRSTRAGLAELGEPAIEATLARIARNQNGHATESDDDQDPDLTRSLGVGGPTGDGQRFQNLERGALALLEALTRANPADAESRRSRALGLKSLAIILQAVGKDDDALAFFGRSRDLFRALAEADPADRRLQGEWAGAEQLYGTSLMTNNRPSAGVLEAVERARSILEAAVKTDPRTEDLQIALAEVYGKLAMALEVVDRMEEALAMYQRARDLFEALFRANPSDERIGHELARTLGNVGLHLVATGVAGPKRWLPTNGLWRSSRWRATPIRPSCASTRVPPGSKPMLPTSSWSSRATRRPSQTSNGRGRPENS
jgi:tetratricopeptide (TPR) repeat protein